MTTLEVKVWRGGADGDYQRYAVPREDSQTVLDVVTYIQRRLDPTLAYRFACRVGMCGSCAMTVNGARALDLPHARGRGRDATAGWRSGRSPTCRWSAIWSPT